MTYPLMALYLLISFCSSSERQKIKSKADGNVNPEKVLIVYLSRTGNTKSIAEIIHKFTGGKLVLLELETPYPENYRATVEQVVKENESGYLPPLKTRIDSIEKYEIIFVGFPTWGMKLPPPMKSFLHQYNFDGKTIVPFNTNDGYGIGSSFDTVRELCPKSIISEGFSIKGGRENGQSRLDKEENRQEAEIQVKQWLQKLKLIKGAP